VNGDGGMERSVIRVDCRQHFRVWHHTSTVKYILQMRAKEESTGSRYDESKIRVWFEMVAGQEVTLKTISLQVGFSVVHVLSTAAHST
jgi:hypothetical protein